MKMTQIARAVRKWPIPVVVWASLELQALSTGQSATQSLAVDRVSSKFEIEI